MNPDTNSPLEILIEEMQAQQRKIRTRIEELSALTEMTQVEVTRLRMQSTEMSKQIRNIEDALHLGETPAANFVRVYHDYLEVRVRFATVQVHLERINQDRTQYEYFAHTLDSLVAIVQPPPNDDEQVP